MTDHDVFKLISLVSKQTSTDVYVVGGYVRDQLLKKTKTKDIDFVVLGSGIAFAQAFDMATKKYETEFGIRGRLVLFEDFDTARYLFLDEKKEEAIVFEIEFAGARKEAYVSGSRKPMVQKAALEEDLERRDFTVNAIACNIGAEGSIGKRIDPCDGQKDIEKKILRTPLDPHETFSDDPLRMLRAARFAAQLDFSLDKETRNGIVRHAKRIEIVSAERRCEEFMKLLATPKPSTGLWILHETRVLDEFFPEIRMLGGVEEVFGYAHKDNLSHTFAVVDNIAIYSEKPLLRFAGLMHDIAKPQTKKYVKGRGWTFDMHEHLGRKITRHIGRRFRMSTSDIEYVATLVRWHLQPIALMDEGITDSAVRRLVVGLGQNLNDLLILCRADITTGNQKKKERRLHNYDMLEARIAEVIEKDKLREFQSPIRGEEIMDICGLKPGPTVGKIKKEIERAILDGDIPNEYEASKVFFLKRKDAFVKNAEAWEKAHKKSIENVQ